MTGTVSVHDDGTAELDAEPCLVRVLRCEAPLDAPVRVPLQGATSIVLGRGDAEVTRAGSEITVRVPDDRMSTIHARLSRTGRKLVIADQGSKNGTIVNGRRIETHELADGDVLEIGHTFFIYRYAPTGLGATPAVVADGDGELALATFVPSLARQYDSLARVAPSMVPVVVLGETGTGKEVVARAAHRMSGRSGPFVAINCGAIPANLIESELFGVKRGAFSGATDDRPGLVRSADGGTLFLDEIGELPMTAQVALLRVLQEREVLPVGGTRPVPVDVRLLAATHQPLDRLVDAERFRSDLYARLGGLHLKLPALRERRDDLGLIIASLIRRIAANPERVRLSRQTAAVLLAYPFPRNIRELETSLGLAITMATTRDGVCMVELEHLPETLRTPAPPAAAVDEDEQRRAQLVVLLTEHRGRIADVARAMGKARMQIHRWLQRYEIDIETFRKP